MLVRSRTTRQAASLAALALGLPLALSACGSGGTTPAPSTSAPAPASTSASAPATEAAPSASTAEPSTAEPSAGTAAAFGPGCSKIPTTGKGSFDGMSKLPVASAAANNPLLSTLVTAVKKAGLVDTLNNTPDITVFAPDNDAFKALGKKTLTEALASKSKLSKILTTHVVKGQLSPDDLAGKHKTLSGSTITVTGSGEDFTVNGNAKVICGNIKTANATVYVIDHVLMP